MKRFPTALVALFLALSMVAMSGRSFGEDYPSRSIHLVVPTGAGGITDLLARVVADKLSRAAGQSVVVENRPGAGGIIGSDYVARAPPDGYTLLFAFPSHAVNAGLYAKLPYDTINSFAPVTMVSAFPSVLDVRSDFPAKTLQALIAMAKAQADPLNYSSVGNGSLGFLAAELFALDAGIKLVQVPYKGAPQATMALLAGDVSLFFDTPVTSLPLIKSGKVRALAVTSKARDPSMPDVPAISEAVPGYEALGWNGVLAPKGTPDAVVDRLNQLIVTILHTPEMNKELTAEGVEVVGDSPAEFDAAIRADVKKWGDVIKKAGIKPE